MLISNRNAEVGQRTPVWIAKIATALPAIAETVLPVSEPAPAASTDSMKFANPFDPTEIFEFPAGTSAEDAQARVAEILLQRAQERVPASSRATSAERTRYRSVAQKN
jgi:hypothetical protein